MDPRFELALPCPVGKLRPGFMAAGATQFMAAMLGDDGLDLRQLKSLMPQGIGCLLACLWVQRSTTILTKRRVIFMKMLHVFNRHKLSLVPLVSLLAPT